MSTLDDFKNSFFRLRQKKYALPLALAVTLLIGSVLTYFLGAVCFGALLVALIGFYVPYYFGLKSRVKLAIWGVVFLLVLSVPFTVGFYVANAVGSEGITLGTTGGELVNGTVNPFRGDASTVHTFSVQAPGPNIEDGSVRVVVFDTWANTEVGNFTMTESTVDGVDAYTYSTTLQNQTEYAYYYGAIINGTWTTTNNYNIGPLHVSEADIFIHFLPFAVVVIFFQVGLLFFLLLVFNWFSDRSKKRVQELKEQQAGESKATTAAAPGEKFVCSECGATVPVDAKVCQQCGERFDEAGSGDFVCTECGAKVDEDAKKCWNCGKEFED